jgi:hypothetical protein
VYQGLTKEDQEKAILWTEECYIMMKCREARRGNEGFKPEKEIQEQS